MPPAATLAPAPSTTPAPANTIEHRVGEIVAAAGLVIVEALNERADGGLTPATRTRGGHLIAQLYGLRNFLIADFPNFDAIAREHGTAALRACDAPPATADLLASEVLDLLYRVPEILTRGRFPDGGESDSTWRSQEARHVGSDTIAPGF